MLKHKLFNDSLDCLDFGSSMENATHQNSSPPATPTTLRKKEINRNQNHGNKPDIDSSQLNMNSDNDFLNESNVFLNSLERRPYTYDEDVEILKFVLKDQNIFKVTSILLWKYLEAKKKNPKRSYQSLKNRFLRNIKPKIFMTYRNIIENEDQVRKILEKFPELEKHAKIKNSLPLNLRPRKANDSETAQKVQSVELSETSGKINPHQEAESLQNNVPGVISQIECETAVDKESTIRKVEFCRKSISITVSRSLSSRASPLNDQLGIYEKYLNCKAKNKLVPCPTCGRCGGPEPNEVQDSENEVDVIISSSIENKNSKSPQNAVNPKNKTDSVSDDAVIENGVKKRKSRKVKPPSEGSQNSPDSASLLDDVISPKKVDRQRRSASQSKSSLTKTPSSKASKRKYFTPPTEQRLGHLTDGELESLYQESVQKCEKLMSSEEEEALVKDCFKKNCRSFGFDSYVWLTKCNLDSFFAKSSSPPLDGFSADPVTSAETTGSPLVENMKKMLRSMKYKKC